MGLFNKKKKEQPQEKAEKLNEELRDDISKAYDELIAGGRSSDAAEEINEQPQAAPQPAGDFEAELLKARIVTFKEKKTQEALLDVMKMLQGRQFCLPSAANMKEPFEKVGDEIRLKKGAKLTPALLTSPDKKTFLPIFTDEKSMTRKSPSGIVLKLPFEQCVGIVYNKQNPVTAIVINPFTENLTIAEDALRAVFKEAPKNS